MNEARNELLWAVREINIIYKKRGKEFLTDTPNMKPWTLEYWEELADAAYQEAGTSRVNRQVEILEDNIALELNEALQWLDEDGSKLERDIFITLERLLRSTFKKKDEQAPDTDQLIEEFANYFSEGAEYSRQAIKIYITEWNKRNGMPSQRAKAKRAAKGKCGELRQITSDGTFIHWEDKWVGFRDSRTEN